MKTEFQTHDLTLPDWGPYTKKYSGISHIPAANDGVRFDLAVFPGMYRRRVDVPNVRFESGFHVWQAAPDLSCYTLRHELQWKDQVYADISFFPLADNTRLVRAELCNRTDAWQNLVLHYMASAWDPVPAMNHFPITGAEIRLPEGAAFQLAKDYEDLHFAVSRPMDNLNWDGQRRGEEAVEGFVAGYGIGQNFGCAPGRGLFGQPMPSGRGDWVRFRLELPEALEKPVLAVRYLNLAADSSCYTLSNGMRLILPPCRQPEVVLLPLEAPMAAGEASLTLTADGVGGAKLDCLVLCEEDRIGQLQIRIRESGAEPEIREYPQEGFLTLKYPHIREYYGIAWDYDSVQLRQICNDELDVFLRDTVHNHVSSVLQGNGKGHYTNVFFRPIPLEPGQTRVIWGIVCSAQTQEEAAAACHSGREKRADYEAVWAQASAAMKPTELLPEGQRFALGQQLMQAVLCTNVVYPVYTRSQYIRHNTPGRWWDSLYTWDSGFIGMGLSQFSLRRGYDCLNAYLTPVGDDEAAFIHHGSLVPTQFYLYHELLNQTGSRELAQNCYPRLKQYYDFISGHTGSSSTGNLQSGLLRPWDYFYNSGGWDDYPPQKALHAQHLEARCTPVITTAHVLRCAKILLHSARLLGREAEAQALLEDIGKMTRALNTYAWDEESGYFGYVLHDENGAPGTLFRHESGANYNMGLGGASPLFAGACGEDRAQRLWERLESEAHLWSSCGLSTVDQSAPYFRSDGYWNGAVWMPYQWLFFKAALDAGKTEFAWKLAQTLLELWQEECAQSYHCFEHFMIESRRGAGWHQFSGLSSPIVQFFAAYYRPGTLTAGLNTFVETACWGKNHSSLKAELNCTEAGPQAVLAVLAPGSREVHVSVPGAQVTSRYSGQWEIRFALETPGRVKLEIQ